MDSAEASGTHTAEHAEQERTGVRKSQQVHGRKRNSRASFASQSRTHCDAVHMQGAADAREALVQVTEVS